MNEYNNEDVKNLIRAAIKLNLAIDVSQQYPSIIPQMNELEKSIAKLVGKENARSKTWESNSLKLKKMIKEEIQSVLVNNELDELINKVSVREIKSNTSNWFNMFWGKEHSAKEILRAMQSYTDEQLKIIYDSDEADKLKNSRNSPRAIQLKFLEKEMERRGILPKNIKEYIKSNNELEILTNAAHDINEKYFRGRGQVDRGNYRLAVRDTEDEVVNTLKKNTKVIKKTKGFMAKEDEAQEYYQLPEFNVSVALDSYKVSRATVIQFLSIDGEKPEQQRMYQ